MGQSEPSTSKTSKITSELQLIDHSQNLYLNVHSNRVYQKNDVVIGTIEDIAYELEIFNFRRMNDEYLVSVDYCQTDIEKDICSSFSSLNYFIEKQEYSLLQRQEMPVRQGMRLLLHILKAFEILYLKFGYFTPSSKLIFFNRFSQAKVWINEDPKITKNLQNQHSPRNLKLEDCFIHEIFKIFDALKDKKKPTFYYSQILKQSLLSFRKVEQLVKKRQIELLNDERQLPFKQIKHFPRLGSPIHYSRPFISPNVSPICSPRLVGRQKIRVNVEPLQNPQPPRFSYVSPEPISKTDKVCSFRESIKISLPKSRFNQNHAHTIQPSRQFSSTMPTSLKNSRIEQKNVCIQILSPHFSCNSNVIPLTGQNIAKKAACQRFSEQQATYLGKCLVDNHKKSNQSNFQKQSLIQIENYPIEEMTVSNNTQKSQNMLSSASIKKQFQTHKRHRTDYKIKENLFPQGTINQKSAIHGVPIDKFNCNTIKSIHLLQDDKDCDSSIITDLKQIINKYKLSDRHKQ